MNKNLFEHDSYKKYLLAAISARPKGGRGIRMALAKSLGCPVSHISQVLSGSSHFSPEQAEAVNSFLGHTAEEATFFLLLVQLARAGTRALQNRIEAQIQQIRERRLVLKERLGIKAVLSTEDQATFYSSWIYGAVHVMLSIPEFQTKEAVAQYLGISLERAAEILEFLISIGLAVPQEAGRFAIGTNRIHLGNDSPMISKLHTNWRMKAIQSFDRDDFRKSLHYSSAVTIAEADVDRIKSVLIRTIDEVKAIIRDSKEEGVHCFALDFFRV